jgi:endosialidase-like protein
MSTTVRAIELMLPGSYGKEQLSNDGMQNLALGISGAAVIALTNVDHTLTTDNQGQAQHFVQIVTGALTANVNVIVPAESRVYVADNRTTGAFTVTFKTAAGGGVAVDQGARTLIYCDGTTVYPVASGTGGGGGSGAPTDATYLVQSAHALLTGERAVTNTATVIWDFATPGAAGATIPPDAISYAHIQNVTPTRLLGRFTAGSGDVQEITPGAGLTLDAGTGVLSATAVGQPADATLTALAGLATGANQVPYFTGTDTAAQTPLTPFARTVLDDADQATMQTTLGVVPGTTVQPLDATLTALAGVTTGADQLPFFTGTDTASTTVLTAFMRSFLDDPDAATARSTLGVTGGGGGSSDFLGLTDTPDTYTGQGGKVVAVNAGATALEFITGGGASYTDEQAQDAVGTILTDSATLDFTYDDTTPSITGIVKDASLTEAKLVLADVTTLNASTTAHGLLRKLSGTATEYLDGSGAWSTPAGGSGTPVAFRGCLLTLTAALTGINSSVTPYALPWSVEQYDTHGLHDLVTNTTRITMPAGVARVQLCAAVHLDNFASTGGVAFYIRRNGTTTIVTSIFNGGAYPTPSANIMTPILDVVAGDYFEVLVQCSDTAVDIRANLDTFFSCEIIEPLAIAGVDIETIQDTVGAMLTDSATVDFTYNDTAGTITASTPYSTFVALTDTPDVYAANALKLLRVNAAANAVEFGDVLGTMATQNANAVAIMGGSATFTGTVQAPLFYAPEQSGTNLYGLRSLLAAGTNKWNILADGTAPNYFAGNVGIGIPSPTATKLHILFPSSDYGSTIQPTTGGAFRYMIRFLNAAGVEAGTITMTDTTTTYNTTSDARLKERIATLLGALDVVRALRPVSFRWQADQSPGIGFLAHELQRTIPEAVTGLPDAVNDDGSIRPQGVDHSKLVPWLTAALQDLAAQLDAAVARIALLEEALGA